MATETVTPAAVAANRMPALAGRAHDLAALLSSLGYLLDDVHSNLRIGTEEEKLLRQAARVVMHCEGLADGIACDFEEAPHG